MTRLLPFCSVLVSLTGCGPKPFYEWKDEPYVRPVYEQGEEAALEEMSSSLSNNRDVGCRALAVMGEQAFKRGDRMTAHRIAEILMNHYASEENPQVRSTVVAVCLRDTGRDDPEVEEFLRKCIRSDDELVAAAYTMAANHVSGAFEEISSAFASASDYELKYELLGALWLLGDGRAVEIYHRNIADVDRDWPEEIHHMPKKMYIKTLRSRMETLAIPVPNTK